MGLSGIERGRGVAAAVLVMLAGAGRIAAQARPPTRVQLAAEFAATYKRVLKGRAAATVVITQRSHPGQNWSFDRPEPASGGPERVQWAYDGPVMYKGDALTDEVFDWTKGLPLNGRKRERDSSPPQFWIDTAVADDSVDPVHMAYAVDVGPFGSFSVPWLLQASSHSKVASIGAYVQVATAIKDARTGKDSTLIVSFDPSHGFSIHAWRYRSDAGTFGLTVLQTRKVAGVWLAVKAARTVQLTQKGTPSETVVSDITVSDLHPDVPAGQFDLQPQVGDVVTAPVSSSIPFPNQYVLGPHGEHEPFEPSRLPALNDASDLKARRILWGASALAVLYVAWRGLAALLRSRPTAR